MERGPVLRTDRLLLRRWRDDDLAPFAALNADSEVTSFLPGRLTRTESDAMVSRIEAHFDTHGFGFWAVEVIGGPAFVGMAGLAVVGFEAPFTPAVEVGWRLGRDHWGRGYATEAAKAAIGFGFDSLSLEEVVAFTVPANERSRAVMERLGMTHDVTDDFDHPKLAAGHPLRHHVLYRMRRQAWP